MPEFEKYSAGDPPTFPARTVNAWQEAARDFYARKGGRVASPSLTELFEPANLVLVRNDTAAARPAYSVLKPNAVLVDPANYPHDVRRRPAFAGVAPAAADDPFLVTIDPLDVGQTGRAAAAGVVVCRVNVTDATHQYARPVAGDPTGLASAGTGPARILYKPTGTGVKTAVVQLGLAPPPTFSGARLTQTSPTAVSDPPGGADPSFDSVQFDTDGYRSLQSGVYVLKPTVAGYYLVGATWWVPLSTPGWRTAYIQTTRVDIVARARSSFRRGT
jgi:hypothetical protein